MARFRSVFAYGLAALFVLHPLSASAQTRVSFDLETATVADINRAIDNGALTSEQLVRLSLARIQAYEPRLHAAAGDHAAPGRGSVHLPGKVIVGGAGRPCPRAFEFGIDLIH